MKRDKLILNDGTVAYLEPGASLTGLTAVFDDWTAAAVVMSKLTEENLNGAQVQADDGRVWVELTDVVIQPGAWEKKADGLFITISLREKTELEKRMDSVEAEQAAFNEGQGIQDGAIAELAEITGGEA